MGIRTCFVGHEMNPVDLEILKSVTTGVRINSANENKNTNRVRNKNGNWNTNDIGNRHRMLLCDLGKH